MKKAILISIVVLISQIAQANPNCIWIESAATTRQVRNASECYQVGVKIIENISESERYTRTTLSCDDAGIFSGDVSESFEVKVCQVARR